MLLEKGKRLPTIEQYAALIAQPAVVWSSQDHADTHVFAVESSKGRFRLMPGPELAPQLFRGQNKRYESCVPSLHRIPPLERAFWIVKVFELIEVLYAHPACLDMFQWELEGLTFDFNARAIAQHYWYPTDYLDFSRSRDVAMFFATCAVDRTTGHWSPLQSGTGVLYTADLAQMIVDRRDTLPLGLEPMPRPERQSAFAIPLNPGEDLEAMTWVTSEPFEITAELSERYFEMFEGGLTLFPHDAFDAHIDRVRQLPSYRSIALDFALKQGILPPHPRGLKGAIQALAAMGHHASELDVTASEEVLEEARASWRTRSTALASRILSRGVSDHYQG